MQSLSDKDFTNLSAISESIRKVEFFVIGVKDVKQFYEDEKTFDSVLMNFVVIGESSARLSQEFKIEHGQIPWNRIKAFRNLVAHNYFGINPNEVWQIIHTNLPELKQFTHKILNTN